MMQRALKEAGVDRAAAAMAPFEPGVEITLHQCHEVSNEGLEVRKARSLISRDDEAKLVGVLLRPIQEGAAIDVITGRVVKAARRTLAGDPVAHDVREMRPCRAEVAGNDARVAGFDDHAARPSRSTLRLRARRHPCRAWALPARCGLVAAVHEHHSFRPAGTREQCGVAHERAAHHEYVRAWNRTRLEPCSAPRGSVMARRDGVALCEFKMAPRIVLNSNADFER